MILPFPFRVRMHGREYRVSRAILLTLVEMGERLELLDLGIVLWQARDGSRWLREAGGRVCGPYKNAARVVRAATKRRRSSGRKK